MAGLGALASGGAALYSAFNNSQHPSSSNMANAYPNYYPWSQQAQQYGLQGISNLPYVNAGNQTQPLAWQTAQNLYNNPYAQQYQQGAGVGAAFGQGAAQNQYAAGDAVYGNFGPQVTAASTIMNLGLDPQSALYNRTLGQVTQQTRAGNEARGIDMTPYGGSVEANALGNFNIDWQNNQLLRAISAGGAAGNLYAGANNTAQLAAGLQGGAGNLYGQASAMPYNAYGNIGQGQFGALGAYGQLGQQQQPLALTPTNAYFQYAGLANQGYNGALAANAQNFNQNQIMGNNLGWGLQALGQGYNQGAPGLRNAWNNAPWNAPPNAYGGYNVTGTSWG